MQHALNYGVTNTDQDNSKANHGVLNSAGKFIAPSDNMAEQTLMETDINYAGKGGICIENNVSKKVNIEYALTDNSFKCSVLSLN